MSLPLSSDLSESELDNSPNRFAVVCRGGEYGVVALRPIMPGEVLFAIDGVVSNTPSRYSVQVGRNLHVAPPADVACDNVGDRYLWRFLNHSCSPSAALVGCTVSAIRQISAGDEISFDYNSTEYEMAVPFRCNCGHCNGAEIRGARFLSPSERKQREHLLAEHVRDGAEPAL